ncbi:ABC transporter permease [Mycobacterium sp. Y57]|uniref:ABC transporter permease n=1 Tax=Mycolicibacterium xanthum TaxID=2796469 RepID=UPI001C8620D8|nr:ABC transporter permease [Mycolicibacterium xanthum]MBX7434808.1 ABC transporter permease [Mycolicibacterium xanthum]
MTAPAARLFQAWTAFGRNDIRGTYREPLMAMLVLAPVIWTVGTAVIVPRLTTTVARRYDFDLVPYHPLVLTGLLLLTSIIVVGGLGAFLILDELDSGTLPALRVTPVPLSSFFGYRAGTVVAVTTGYVVATMSLSGLLPAGLVLPLIPIGLVAGLSSVVTMLLIVAVASNKIQGLAMLRLLGLVIAGLPCLAWFVSPPWDLAFGILPPYWPAKAFWVACAGGVWWPYLVGGVVFNLAAGRPLLRRFIAKNT